MKWPGGLESAGLACGIKDDALDLGLLVGGSPMSWSGVFTTNAAAAAPVQWCRALGDVPVRAIVVNSGNANACTGQDGSDAVRMTAESLAAELNCGAEEILVASTGPIGVRLPVDKLCAGLGDAVASLAPDIESFSESILTTDSRTKTASAAAGQASVVGVAKGAAMVAPNMATMLAFLVTDARLEPASPILKQATDVTFGRISIDGCESTNDSVFLLATGDIPVPDEELARAVTTVCSDLAGQIVADAEGGTKIVRISVTGAADETAAENLGKAVAGSNLWRAAVHGADPNWGRVLSALGAADRSLDLTQTHVSIGDVVVFSAGEPTGSYQAAADAMATAAIGVHCIVGSGDGEAQVLTADLSPEYVSLNAEGTS